jgi:exodeoxyribonuclease VII large subunit
MYTKTLTVSSLNNYIKKIIECDFILNNVSIKGEISNFKMHSSGHLYFSLKDEKSKINCIMFRNYAQNLKFMPKEGLTVVVKGKVSVYEKDGSYQIYCSEMIQQGIGELYAAFLELKERLGKQGLFDEEHKKQLPAYPRRVGVITSPTGAAVRDIIRVAKRRNPSIDLLIYPSLVQGESASQDLINGVEALNKIDDIDVIILARGGGSIEELWSFNDEKLAKAVFNSRKPIITGVGHETDFTIVDFVSDRRASTPSAAAEIAVPSLRETNDRINRYKDGLGHLVSKLIKEKHNNIQILQKSLSIYSPMNYILNQYNYIDNLQHKLQSNVSMNISLKKEQLSKANALLEAHNPLKVLSKGYAVIETEDGSIISSRENLKGENKINITLKDGKSKLAISSVETI